MDGRISYNIPQGAKALASAIKAVAPIAQGYFKIAIGLGKGEILASVSCDSTTGLKPLAYRLWWLMDDGTEVDIPWVDVLEKEVLHNLETDL